MSEQNETVYLKINPTPALNKGVKVERHSFYCQISGVKIANKMVVKTTQGVIDNSSRLTGSLANGHIVKATEKEYNAWMEKVSKFPTAAETGKTGEEGGKEPELQALEVELAEMADMEKSELFDYLRDKGYTDVDIKAITKMSAEAIIEDYKNRQLKK